ncbi:MAG: sugar ABC transporter substrate-binding protein [Spirochaetia bacterium]|nr:sugar ABC transporter substrate-binding protein [Spirochaetia bacterium]
MKKRSVAVLLVALMAGALLFAGGNAEKATTASVSKPLSVMIWDSNQQPGIQKIIDDFTAKTGITAEIQVVDWNNYWTLLSAGAQGGSLPDVFWMHSNESQRYMSNDMLLDVTDRIAKSAIIDPENYPDDIWSLYTYNNKYYAVPKDVDTIALWYNRTLFDQAGVKYPDENWTWEDVYAAAKKITKADGSVYGFANVNSNNQAGWYNLIYSNNGYVLSEDKKKSGMDLPASIEAMKWMERMINENLMPPQTLMSESSEDVLLQSGKIAMTMQGSWMVAAFRDNEYTLANCDVAMLPKNSKTGRRASIYNGLGWAIAKNSERTDDAWKLVEYFGSEEGQLKQAQLGVTMSSFKNTSEQWKNSVPQFNLQAYLNMQDDMVIRPFSRSTVKWENAVLDVMLKVWNKEMSMEAGCKEAARQMNAILAEE